MVLNHAEHFEFYSTSCSLLQEKVSDLCQKKNKIMYCT